MEAMSRSMHESAVNMKGRRTLHYENTSLLKGKSIYLDLHGYKSASFIESGLRERGAAIESFFTRDIRYLVTSRILSDQDKHSSSPRTPSSSVLCNNNISVGNRKSSHTALSPFSTNSPDTPKATPFKVKPTVSHEQHLHQHSRSRNIVAAAKMKSSGSNDVIQLAKSWDIRIIHVEDIVKYFAKHPVGKEASSTSERRKSSSSAVRKLKPPFLRCEDISRKYKPLVLEVKKWPELNLNCGPDECPFDNPQKQRRDTDVKVKAEKSGKKRPGYCECCCVRFDDFSLHVKGDQHMAFATNANNYASLDALYEVYGIPTLDQFVSAHMKKKSDKTLPEMDSSPVKYSLLCYSDNEIPSVMDSSTVDIETVTELDCDKQFVSQNLKTDSAPVKKFTPHFVTPIKDLKSNSAYINDAVTPESNATFDERGHPDVTPDAKRRRRLQSRCSPPDLVHSQAKCATPPRTSPIKDFSIVLHDTLKSPLRSSSANNTLCTSPQVNQSPEQCVTCPVKAAVSPNLLIRTDTSMNKGNRRIIRSASVSPEQRNSTSRDPLMGSPTKDDKAILSPAKVYTVSDVSPEHLKQSRDILLASSSQSSPQKQ